MLRRSGRSHHNHLTEKVLVALSNNIQREAVLTATRHTRQRSVESYGGMRESDKLLSNCRRIKREAVLKITENVVQFTSNAESRGIRVFHAKTKKDAVGYVMSVLSAANARLVVKTKSMACEELDLNNHLSQAGFTVVETDLGERIVQMAGQKPSHLVVPAIHMNVRQVAEIFSQSLGVKVPEVAEEITKLARKTLRHYFLTADAGISGANFAIEDDGSILIVTNEGNERLVTSLPRIYICVIGIEKIVPTLKDALTLTQALCMSATGQRMASYVSVISGPNDKTGIEGSDKMHEMHVVLLDNERSKIAEDELFRQALYCLKCGSCLNVCPTYRVVGGHVFGHNYTGPIGIPWTSFTAGYDAAAEFAPLCISCGLCKLACPEDINIPLLIANIKESNVRADGQVPVNWFLSNYESFVKIMSITAPIANELLSSSIFRGILEKTVGIDRRRKFPLFVRKTFENWYKSQRHIEGTEVVYFVDTYANFNNPEIGKAALRLLSRMGYKVVLPKQKGSGFPAFLYGELRPLKEIAQYNVECLLPFAAKGIPIVASEPTAAFCLRELYPELLRTEDARIVARNSFEILGFLSDHWDSSLLKIPCESTGKAGYHTPCHTRSLYANPPAPNLLRKVDINIEVIDFQGCCGIGGTYGFKKGADGFDVSMAIGKELFTKIREMRLDYLVTESSVCKIQMEQGLGFTVRHPLEVLSERLQIT